LTQEDKIDPRAIKYVDTREKGSNKENDTLRTRLAETGWFPKWLYSGDFYFLTHDYKKVGITRKNTDDLVASIGKVWSKQLDEMLDFYDLRKILIEGSWSKIRPSYVIGFTGISYLTWDNIWDYLNRWMDKGFTIELTISEEHTIHRLNRLYAIYQKPYSLTSNSNAFTDDRILAFPSGCRGKTAQQILEKGNSIVDIGQMSIEMLQCFDKIGEKKANSIRNHFNRRTENSEKQ
jgi:ERCC4-type nuclease